MKNLILILILSITTSIFAETLDEKRNFIEQVNKAWKLENYQKIYELAKERINNQENDLLEIGILSMYYVYGEPKHELAQQYINRFISILDERGYNELSKFTQVAIKKYINEIKEDKPLSKEEIKHIHTISPTELPFATIIYKIAIQVQKPK